MKLAYGDTTIDSKQLNIVFDEVLIKEPSKGSKYGLDSNSIQQQLKLMELRKIIRCKVPGNAAILVEDRTRKNLEYPIILSSLIELLNQEGIDDISLVIAYGTHAHHLPEENIGLYGEESLNKVKIVNHNPHVEEELSSVGIYHGHQVKINRVVTQADLVVSVGSVKPHAFAGFTGGRKIILPGVADYESIRYNHALVKRDGTTMGKLSGNPIHEGMAAIASLVNVDFAIQMIKGPLGELDCIEVGTLEASFMKATVRSEELSAVNIMRQVDVVVVSVGGKPKDNNLYLSQRAVTTAVKAVKDDGIVFVIAQLEAGVGNKLYEEWLIKDYREVLSLREEEIEVGIHSAYLTAKNFRDSFKIYLLSDQSKAWSEKYHFGYVDEVDHIREIVENRYGQNYTSILIPNGSDIMIGDV